MTDYTKAIVDYSNDENAVAAREALYSAINDKVMAHIDAKKQEIAQTLITPQSEPDLSSSEDTEV